MVHCELNMSGNLYFQPHYTSSRLRLHIRNRIVRSYIKKLIQFCWNTIWEYLAWDWPGALFRL